MFVTIDGVEYEISFHDTTPDEPHLEFTAPDGKPMYITAPKVAA